MKIVYLIYVTLPSSIYDSRIKYLMDSRYNTFRYKNDYVTGLYAWTNKKDMLKKFISTRADIFNITKEEMSDKNYKGYKKDYSDLRLEERRFFTDISFRETYSKYIDDNPKPNEYMDVVTTKFEFRASTIELSENMMSFGPASFLSYDYKIFNEKIINALDVLQYNSLYDTYIPTNPESDEMLERKTICDYNESFNITSLGNDRFTFDSDEYTALLYLFGYLFFNV